MEDEDIIDLLTQIKGVGRWTVEMILMFTLAREDVFAADDLAIQQSMAKIYDIDTAINLKPLPCTFINSTLGSSLRYFRSFAIYTSILLPLK